jgi:hypothetical protein
VNRRLVGAIKQLRYPSAPAASSANIAVVWLETSNDNNSVTRSFTIQPCISAFKDEAQTKNPAVRLPG